MPTTCSISWTARSSCWRPIRLHNTKAAALLHDLNATGDRPPLALIAAIEIGLASAPETHFSHAVPLPVPAGPRYAVRAGICHLVRSVFPDWTDFNVASEGY